MSDVEPEALADVAYGLFEHTLNKELRDSGACLFELVESNTDFFDTFNTIFSRFSEDYPQLAEALITKFGSPEIIYRHIMDGEGVVRGKTTKMYWIVQDAPDVSPDAIQDELAGKWLIFLPPEEVDVAWKKVRDATWKKELGISAKVSTAKPNPDSRDNMKVIYVYTLTGVMKVMSCVSGSTCARSVLPIASAINVILKRSKANTARKEKELRFIVPELQALRSLFFGRRFWYPHLRQRVARIAFLALQRMHIFTLSVRASASGNRAIRYPPLSSLIYNVIFRINGFVYR